MTPIKDKSSLAGGGGMTSNVVGGVASVHKVGKWYFGGVAGTAAASCTYPFSLVKVHFQTVSAYSESPSILRTFAHVFRSDGLQGLYCGLSASILRQMIFNTTRFAIYEGSKNYLICSGSPITIDAKITISGCAGFLSALMSSPVDMIVVRMQTDMKTSKTARRNYKHVFDGLFRVVKEEGFMRLFGGCSMTSSRGALMSIGQMTSYDTIKEKILILGLLNDNQLCYFVSSTIAGAITTFLTLPLDVLKTKMMNARLGEFNGLADCFYQTLKIGPTTFFRGFSPAFMRLAPQTILTFLFLEQLKNSFGQIVVVNQT